MVICPIAKAVHCTGCLLVKFCPAKTILGDYGKEIEKWSRQDTDAHGDKPDATVDDASGTKTKQK